MKRRYSTDEIEGAAAYTYKTKGKGGQVWQGRLTYYEEHEDGTRTRRTVTKSFDPDEVGTKAQASKATAAWHRSLIEEARRREAAEEQAVYELKHPTWTVPDYAEKVVRDYSQATESSKHGYRPYLNRIRQAFGDTTLEDLTADDVNRWHRAMKLEGLSNTTIVHAHALLSQTMKQAVEDGLVTENVCKRRAAKPPRRDHKEHNVLKAGERGRLMDYLANAEPSPLTVGAWIALETGMRIGEICGLAWADVDLEAGIVHVRKSIGKKQGGRYVKDPKSISGIRDLPISEALRAVLRARKADMWEKGLSIVDMTADDLKNLYVIGRADGRYYDPDVLSREWRVLRGVLQLQGTQGAPTFHDLRHTAITVWIRENGIDPYTASKMAGHSSPAHTLKLYGSTDEEAMRRASDAAAATLERERAEAERRRLEEQDARGHLIDLATGTER